MEIQTKNNNLLSNLSHKMIAEWHGDVGRRLEEISQKFPNTIAIYEGEKSYRYQQLSEQSNRLAHWLISLPLQREDVVGIYTDRNSLLILASMAICKAGLVGMTLPINHPSQRLQDWIAIGKPKIVLQLVEHMVEEVYVYLGQKSCPVYVIHPNYWNPSTVHISDGITQVDVAASLAQKTMANLSFGHESEIPQNITSLPIVNILPETLFWLLFTSGSTGVPKAVQSQHSPLTHHFDWQREYFQLTQHTRFAVLAGIAHVPIIRDIFSPLMLGASMYIPESIEPQKLRRWLRAQKINFCQMSPSLMKILAEEAISTEMLPDLHAIMVGGDILTRKTVANFQAIAPHCSITNTYGSTENPLCVSIHTIPTVLPNSTDNIMQNGSHETIPVGQGIPGVQFLIVRNDMQLCNKQEPGEIYIRTPYLSLGYKDNPVANAQKYTASPWNPEERIFRTGDLGQYNAEGNIEILGRMDNMVKIRGFRVEIKEIEATIESHPLIQSCSIDTQTDQDGITFLIAYIYCKQKMKVSEIRAHIQKKLPEYNVPKKIYFVDEIPLTANNKPDKAQLAQTVSYMRQSHATRLLENQAIHLEHMALQQIWQDILQDTEIGVDDNFFDAGGNSLDVSTLVSRVQKEFDLVISPGDVFKHPTVRELYQVFQEVWNEKSNDLELNCIALRAYVQGESTVVVFCIAPKTEFGIYFRTFLQYLPKNFALYLLPGANIVPIIPHQTLTETYLCAIQKQMQEIPMTIPIYFLGYCSGGWVASECVRMLQEKSTYHEHHVEKKHRIVSVILIDTPLGYKTFGLFSRYALIHIWRLRQFLKNWEIYITFTYHRYIVQYIPRFLQKTISHVALWLHRICHQESPAQTVRKWLWIEMLHEFDQHTPPNTIILFHTPETKFMWESEWTKKTHETCRFYTIHANHWNIIHDPQNIRNICSHWLTL